MTQFLNPALAGLTPYTPGEQPQTGRCIKLNTNESPFPPAPGVAAAVAQAAQRLQLYPNPACTQVVRPLAARLGLAEEQVLVGNGSDEVLAFCFLGFCVRGAAFADVTYGFYPVYANLCGVPASIVPLREDFTLAPEDYADLGKTIFIANPNAPTGLALPRAGIEQVLRQNPGSLVVVDEAYVDFGAESAVPLLAAHPNLLVVGTFSKSRSLAGARLGYAAGSPALIADLNRIRFSFNPYNVNSMTLAAAEASLADDTYFRQCLDEITATREEALRTLCGMGFACTGSMANFVFARHPALGGAQLCEELRRRGTLVRWFGHPRTRDYLRITIGTGADMQTLYAQLEEIAAQPAIQRRENPCALPT